MTESVLEQHENSREEKVGIRAGIKICEYSPESVRKEGQAGRMAASSGLPHRLLPSVFQIFHNPIADRLGHLLLVILLNEKPGFLRVAEEAAFS